MNVERLIKVRGVCVGVDDDSAYLIRNGSLIRCTLSNFQLVAKARVPELPILDGVISGLRLLSRVFRRGPVTGAVGRQTICFYTRRRLFLFDKGNLGLLKVVEIAGFFAPLNVVFDKFAESDEYIFGEYSSNVEKKAVGMYRFSKAGLKSIGHIPEKEIEHIHNMIPVSRNRHLVLTGDFGESPSFWIYDSGVIQKVIGGRQEYRSCVALCTDEMFIYPTDTTTQENHLYSLHLETQTLTKLANLPASSIYGDTSPNELVFATNLEPSLESKFTWKKWLTRELPGSFSTAIVHVYSYKLVIDETGGQSNGTLNEILRFKPSKLPYRLFQYPTCRLWLRGGYIVLYGISVKGYDGMTMAMPSA